MTLFAETPSNYAGVHTVCMCARLIRQSARIKPKVSQAGCEFGAAKAKNKSGDFQRTQHARTHTSTRAGRPLGLQLGAPHQHTLICCCCGSDAMDTGLELYPDETLQKKNLGKRWGNVRKDLRLAIQESFVQKCSSLNSEQHYICFSKE